MPTLQNVTVHVTDDQGNVFQEWGIQSLKNYPKASAYIKSTTDMPFRVYIQPMIPYPDPEAPSAGRPSSSCTRSDSDSKSSNRHSKSERSHKDKGSSFSSPLRSSRHHDSPSLPNFDFLASLYVDGRQIPERRTVVYLDPRDPDFTPPSGKVRFKSRLVQGHDGIVKELAWVFKDVGIETSFEKLLISKEGHSTRDFDEPVEDALIRGMNSTFLSSENGFGQQKAGKVGQIVVTLERVQLGRKSVDPNYHTKHREGDQEDCDMFGTERDITHTTGLTHVGNLPRQSMRVVDFYPYIHGEGNYATFQFFYRSQECLEKFNFDDFPQTPKKHPRKIRHLNTEMANKTPLSIAYPKQSSTKSSKPKGKAYEENVRDQTFGDSRLNFQCKDEYRDTSASATKDGNSHARSQVDALDLKASSRDRGQNGDHKIGSSGQDGNTENLLNIASFKQNDRQINRLITPPPTSSAESSCSPPSSMTQHLAHKFFPPKVPYAPVDNNLESKKENVPPGPYLSKDYRPFMSSSTANTKLWPPTPLSTISILAPNGETIDNLVVSKQLGEEPYRQTTQSSDADDERGDSDLANRLEGDEEDQGLYDPNDFTSADKDDDGLHEQLEAVSISARKRSFEEEAGNDAEEKAAASGLEDGEAKTEVGGGDGGLAANRQRRNAITQEDKKVLEEISRVKRVKIVVEEAFVVPEQEEL